MIDGYIARALHQESASGAKLDSIADFIMALSLIIIVIKNIAIPSWIWLGVIVIATLRLIAYLIGFHKYHTFSSLHTYANKLTGILLFISPIIYYVFGLTFTGILLVLISLLSTIEELLITLNSKELNRDIKSIFDKNIPNNLCSK